MKTMTLKTIAAMLLAAVTTVTAARAQGVQGDREKMMNTRWTRVADGADSAFFTTAEAARIGDNLLEYQSKEGGWPKNIKMQRELTAAARKDIKRWKAGKRYATIDNKATTTEIKYLARLYNATKADKYRAAVERAFGYLFEAQYSNGGWPQFYPLAEGYYTHITYNDDAMVNVLKLMRDAARGKAPLGFLPDSLRAKAKASLDKGVDCILKTQVVQDGKPTVWCAQHDERTLEPADARAYELISLSGAESNRRQARAIHQRRRQTRLPGRAVRARRRVRTAVGEVLHHRRQPPLLLRPRRSEALRHIGDRLRAAQRLQLV